MKNVSEFITQQADKLPHKKAIGFPKKMRSGFDYQFYTFIELEQRINALAYKLTELGVKPQDKVLFFIKPNLDFCAITFALFRVGAIPVFIDPGMKKKYFFRCLKELNPEVLIGIPKALMMSQLFFPYFKSIKLKIASTEKSFLGKPLLENLKISTQSYPPYHAKNHELAAILYTSGGTGKPKGVEYTHDIFISQTQMLQKEFSLTSDDCDIPGFPLFSFFTLSMGMTSVIPHMDAAKPAQANPKYLYQNIKDNKASFVAGSPAIWSLLAEYCYKYNLTLPSVKYMVMFGAPVDKKIHEYFAKILPHGTTFTPYGATECLPVANISGKELLSGLFEKTKEGAGICIGKPLAGVEVAVVKMNEEKVVELDSSIGEIIVHSPNVTRAYYQDKESTEASKLIYKDKLWHRMGDMGYFDQEKKLWFCGRLKHAFEFQGHKVYPVQIEQILNQHPKIQRCALVYSHKLKQPCLFIVVTKNVQLLKAEVFSFIKEKQLDYLVKNIRFVSALPVDTRHNIKIDRIKLAHEH
ncbi:MAG: hypothetical protein CME62_18180 [Halobacteriovoraceae bacterium]|nr:hypothetical protein [Halobacteriovoraceae bacterium]|tara:strand:- start:12423 stop:13994 length:1572 start_codon:yes stop_codon:yes gene_type:complete